MNTYFFINDGSAQSIEGMKEVQKIIATVDSDLIDNIVLLRIRIEAARECRLPEKALDEWEELGVLIQTWDEL